MSVKEALPDLQRPAGKADPTPVLLIAKTNDSPDSVLSVIEGLIRGRGWRVVTARNEGDVEYFLGPDRVHAIYIRDNANAATLEDKAIQTEKVVNILQLANRHQIGLVVIQSNNLDSTIIPHENDPEKAVSLVEDITHRGSLKIVNLVGAEFNQACYRNTGPHCKYPRE